MRVHTSPSTWRMVLKISLSEARLLFDPSVVVAYAVLDACKIEITCDLRVLNETTVATTVGY